LATEKSELVKEIERLIHQMKAAKKGRLVIRGRRPDTGIMINVATQVAVRDECIIAQTIQGRRSVSIMPVREIALVTFSLDPA